MIFRHVMIVISLIDMFDEGEGWLAVGMGVKAGVNCLFNINNKEQFPFVFLIILFFLFSAKVTCYFHYCPQIPFGKGGSDFTSPIAVSYIYICATYKSVHVR